MTISPPKIDYGFSFLDKSSKSKIRQSKNHEIAMTFLEENAVIFDSNKLFQNPQQRFKNLSIGDFDLYCATAVYVAMNIGSISSIVSRIILDINRINRIFRIRLVYESGAEKITCPFFIENKNIVSVEIVLNLLNSAFGLIEMPFISEFHKKMIEFRLKSITSDLDVFPIRDVFLVLLKIVRNLDPNWISPLRFAQVQASLRGYRSYLTRMHPELLV